MSKILTICVPTYNRVEEFRKLAREFLEPAISTFPDLIEIYVFDNSDALTSDLKRNEVVGYTDIKFFRNEKNIGFAGNFLKCIEVPTDGYIWVISDDDFIDFKKFKVLLDFLRNKNDRDLIMLPFTSNSAYGERFLTNTSNEFDVENDGKFSSLIDGGKLPFILFSSAIIRRNALNYELLDKYKDNAYFQIVAYSSFLSNSSSYEFYDEPLIHYNPGYLGKTARCSWMAASLRDIRLYFKESKGITYSQVDDFNGWLLWLLHHFGGQYHLHQGDADRMIFTKQFLSNRSLKGFVIILSIWMPRSVLRHLYLLYWTYVDQKKYAANTRFIEIKRRYVFYRSFVKDLAKRVKNENAI